MKEFNYKWNLSDLKNVEPNGLKVFSCFAGGGGSSMGYKMAGYDVIGCNEIDKKQMEIYQVNLNPKHSYLMDIREFRQLEDLPAELFNLDILDASFPCSLFSTANLKADDKKGKEVKFREGQQLQTLDDLAFETIKLVDRIKPRVVVFENVKGLLQEKNSWYVNEIYKQFAKIGYKVFHKLINCADLGVPQKRQRVFFFAARDDLNVKTSDMFGEFPYIDIDYKQKHITMGEIDQDHKGRKPSEHVLKYMKSYIPSDDSIGSIRERLEGKRAGFGSKIITDKCVCSTVRAGTCDFIKKDHGNIMFSDYELLQVGAWPHDYDFINQRVGYILGMSVPPLAMYRISKEIASQWLGV